MIIVDEILATGWYADRRGRVWRMSPYQEWVCARPPRFWVCTPRKMRLLIERDQHRGECVGLHDCYVHPTPRILFHDGLWSVVAPGLQAWQDSRHIEFADAWDAARALAVGS